MTIATKADRIQSSIFHVYMSVSNISDRRPRVSTGTADKKDDTNLGEIIDGTGIFGQPKVPEIEKPQERKADSEAVIKPESYRYLSRNQGLIDRVCRVYGSHVEQFRNGTRQKTIMVVRHDDPAELRAEIRKCITDLDTRGGVLLGFGKDIQIVGGTSSRKGADIGAPEETVRPAELQKIVQRLEVDVNIDLALGEEDGLGEDTAYALRHTDYRRTVDEKVMNSVNNDEPSLLLRLMGRLRISGKTTRSLPQYLDDKLSIFIRKPRSGR